MRLSGLSGYREGFGTCKWHFLARYFFGDRFSNLDPSFDFSSRSIPLSSEPSAFYRNCLSLLSSLRSKHGSLPADFSDFSCGTISAFFSSGKCCYISKCVPVCVTTGVFGVVVFFILAYLVVLLQVYGRRSCKFDSLC